MPMSSGCGGGRLRAGLAAAAIAVLAAAMPAAAQEFPSRNVTIVLPLAAGTGMDSVARIYADELSKALGKPVVIENQPGAGLMLAAANVARANPDGHTLVVSTSGPMAINPALYKKINYDPDKDFVPIALYVKSPFVLIVDPKLPIKAVPEFIAAAKAAEKPMTYATPGAGTAMHLSMEFMKQKFAFAIDHVPYRSTPQAVNDVVGGHVNASFAETGASLALIRDGQLRALAVTSLVRLPFLPDVPTLAEATKSPDFEAVSWHVLMAPAATPKPIVDKLHAEMKRITTTADFRQKAATIGLLPIDTPSVEEMKTYMAAERKKWGDLVEKLGLAGKL